MLPISGWMGDNLLKKSTNMTWWSGVDVEVGKEPRGSKNVGMIFTQPYHFHQQPHVDIIGVPSYIALYEFGAQE
eukprot:3153847-Amphidinium_carterae.1